MQLPILTEGELLKTNAIITSALEKSKEAEDEDVHLMVYTDGGCDNNGDKVGGWGIHAYWYTKKSTNSNSNCKGFSPTHDGYVKGKLDASMLKANVLAYSDFFGGLAAPSTNNLAEMAGLLQAFELSKAYPIKSLTIHIDSDYVKRGLTEYITGWIKRNWVTSTGKPVANKEVWEKLIIERDKVVERLPKASALKIIKVKGHSGDAGNDKADELATAGAWGQRTNPSKDSNCFKIASIDDYWGVNTFHPLFTETRLFFNPNLINQSENFYYQSNLPYAGSEVKKEQVICKRITDLLISVVKLDEPEPVIEGLQDYVVNTRKYTGVFKTRLDSMKNVNNYQHLEEYPDGRYLVFNDSLQSVQLPNKTNIFNVINQARLSYKIFSEFDYTKEVLLAIEGRVPGYDLIAFDITDKIFDKIPKGKSKEVFVNKLNGDLGDSIEIPISIPDQPVEKLTLTFGVDAPSKLGFNKFKDINPVITVYLNMIGSAYFNYYVHIKVDGGAGLWCAPYSNEILLPTK